MLVIRNEQMQVFARSMVELYIDRATDYVARQWPLRAADYPQHSELRDFVETCVRRGMALKFRREAHLKKLLDWECEFGPSFLDAPRWAWVKEILNKDLDQATKLFRIGNRIGKLREKGSI